MPEPLSQAQRMLLGEIETLATAVARARAQIAAGAGDIAARHIPLATDELGAITAHTAHATDSILQSCEALQALGGRLARDDAHALQDCLTRIYEACSFHDITGQRVAKVVAALQAIERTVSHMIGVFTQSAQPAQAAGRAESAAEDHGLLNGPQLPTLALDQRGIDALLARLDCA